jgi:triacylglycerol lipase
MVESLFISSSKAMGAYTGETENGFVIDESWQQNDGLVNTNSAMAPSSAPKQDFDKNNITAGVWNVMPVYEGDHMSLQGGFFKVNTDVLRLYTEHFDMINKL